MSLENNRANRRTDTLAAALAHEILSGHLPQGGKLGADMELCAQYGVSRTVLREALRLLTAKGLIYARPRLGTIVAAQTDWALWDRDIMLWRDQAGHRAAMLAEITDIRLALEPSLAALAAARADLLANQQLQAVLRELEADAGHENRFLTALYAAAGNSMAASSVHLAHWAVAQRSVAMPLAAYRDMTAAIAQKDGGGARAAAFQAIIGA
jgi:DNA-binding FadR family transcriptional regulator